MDLENPLVRLVREHELARLNGMTLNNAQALVLAIETRRNFDASFRKLRAVAETALKELAQDYRPEGVAQRIAEKCLEDGVTETMNPHTVTITDLMRAFPTLLRRIMGVLSAHPTNTDDLRSLLNDLVAMARSSTS